MANRETRKKEITAQRQEQILKAAMNVFGRKGYAGATVPEIAREAGVAAGTIYLYYPGKREMFVAVVRSLIISPLASIFTKNIHQDFDLTLQEALEDRFRLLKSDSLPVIVSLMSEIQRDSELKALFSEKLLYPFLNIMEAMYRARMESGEFRNLEPSIAVRMVGSLMIGMTMLKGIEGDTSPLNKLSAEEIVKEVMNFIACGLLEPKERGGTR